MLKAHLSKENGAYVLILDGILDISTIDVLDKLDFAPVENDSNALKALIVDFSNLFLIDSTGIAAILRLVQLFKSRGFQVRLEGMNDIIKNVLETTGVLKILESAIMEESENEEGICRFLTN